MHYLHASFSPRALCCQHHAEFSCVFWLLWQLKPFSSSRLHKCVCVRVCVTVCVWVWLSFNVCVTVCQCHVLTAFVSSPLCSPQWRRRTVRLKVRMITTQFCMQMQMFMFDLSSHFQWVSPLYKFYKAVQFWFLTPSQSIHRISQCSQNVEGPGRCCSCQMAVLNIGVECQWFCQGR